MKADDIIISAIMHGNCPFMYHHVSKAEWKCESFDNCKQCAEKLLELHDIQKENKNE